LIYKSLLVKLLTMHNLS